MKRMMEESDRRRKKQVAYNTAHGITPKTIYKTAEEVIASTAVADVRKKEVVARSWAPIVTPERVRGMSPADRLVLLEELKEQMSNAARDLEFERAAELRDEIKTLEKL
jgi:excinuclease ABC subunit B